MVLQRNQPISITGQTTISSNVSITFNENTYQTIADSNGDWTISIDSQQAGGPYQMVIEGDERVIIDDILIGDVWILGGQSNMEIPINRTLDLFSEEMKAVNQPFIRQFAVPQQYNFHEPKQMVEGGNWISATPSDVMHFSAVGYFFANELYEKYGVPIGLILTAVGGTPIEAWMKESTLRKLGGYEVEMEKNKDDEYVAATQKSDQERHDKWYEHLNAQDIGLQGVEWFKESTVVSDWNDFIVPNSWKHSELEAIRGSVWFVKEFDLPASMTEGEAMLKLGTIVDADDTYINGVLVGTTGYKYPPRRYPIPKSLLRPGKNTITVRVISTQTTGEFIKDMPYKIISNGEECPLDGTWKFKIGAITDTLAPPTFFQYKPSGVYNHMIAPLAGVAVSGVLWYQGESNTAQPKGYHKLFQHLVTDWRDTFKLGDIPFLFTQLANFRSDDPDHKPTNWAELREEQRKSLAVPHTAMAVTIDIGEYNDLHPQDKKTLGQRLALCAQNLVYGEEIVYSGPIYKQMEREGNAIRLSFDHVGNGLVAKDGELQQFSICGADKNYVDASATIEGDTVLVRNEEISEPQHVRYAWTDNPEGANLYNQEGLPASPFSTEV